LTNPIPVNTPVITDEDRLEVQRCLESGWVSSEGPQVKEFEELFAATVKRNFGIAVSSGTAALDVALRALDLGPGDEVLVPSLTIFSCASSIVSTGATPVPVDCDPTDWNAHLEHFQSRLTLNTRAVMLVHLYGLCADLDPILNWAEERGLTVIEDASQGMGLKYKGRPCGSIGHCSIFSLYANKLITTGEGGVILTDSSEFAARCRSLRNLCFDPRKRFWHEEIGWNYRMSAMQAALGIPQLSRLDALLDRKRDIGATYQSAFKSIECVHTAPVSTPWCVNVYWVFGLVVKQNNLITRDQLATHLSGAGIGTRTFFFGLHQQPALLRKKLIQPAVLPVTESLSQHGLYLPSGLGLNAEQQARVIDSVMSVFEKTS
jgi:perosamine synthetase